MSRIVAWDLGPATLTSITAWRAWDWLPSNDTDAISLSVFAAASGFRDRRPQDRGSDRPGPVLT